MKLRLFNQRAWEVMFVASVITFWLGYIWFSADVAAWSPLVPTAAYLGLVWARSLAEGRRLDARAAARERQAGEWSI